MLFSRRRFLALLSGTAIGAGVTSSCAEKRAEREAGKKQVNIYSWPDYIHPDTIPKFERRYGIKVVYDTVASNEALISKFEAGASNYDIIVPTNYAVFKLIELGLLQPIEKERIPNLKHIMPHFLNREYDPGSTYSVPYTFGTTGIAYNALAFPEPPSGWDVFWQRRAARRMTLLEDARETIGMALRRRGYSGNSGDHAQIDEAFADLVEQKPLVMCYTSDQVITALASGDSLLSLSFSGDAYQARRSNAAVRYIIPASGASMWIDSFCIPKKSPHPEYAHLWIDFMLDPEISAANANHTCYATPNGAALKYIQPEHQEDPNLYPPREVLINSEELRDVGEAIFYFDRKWTELKCI